MQEEIRNTPTEEEELPTAEQAAEGTVEEAPAEPTETEKLQAELAGQKEAYLRLAAEYDNYRRRTQKEKDRIYSDAAADTTEKFLGLYDDLERAVAQETADEAYKKGVVMIMAAYEEIMKKLGVARFGEEGDSFDPNCHNAVMHEENPDLGENVITTVFQKGFRLGDKIIRPAMVKVAN